MNENQNNVAPPVLPAGDEQIKVVDLLIVLAKHKKLVVGAPLIAAAIAAAIAFALPPVFRADTTLLPPQQGQSGAAALLAQLGGAAGMVAGAAGMKSPSEMYIGMLKSRAVSDALIKRFSLHDVYALSSLEQVRFKLEEATAISSGKDGMLKIVVEDLDGARAAQIANAYVDELEKLTKHLAVTQSAQRRLFYERQLEMSKNNLALAEAGLKNALTAHGVVSVDSDSRALVETIARLRAQISAKEIQIGSMKAFVTANNVEYKRADEELGSLRAQLSRLENGRGLPDEPIGAEGAKARFESIKLLRDVKYHQMLYELLAKQYEMARLEEANDPSVVQVLDPAVNPERKFKPKRGLIIVLSALAALLLASVAAFVREWYAAPGRARDNDKWNRLLRHLRSGSAKVS